MNKAEAGRLGGLATAEKFKNTPEFCPVCNQVLPLNFYQKNGQKGGRKGHGGLTTLRRHGREHFANMGKQGGRGNKKEKHGNEIAG